MSKNKQIGILNKGKNNKFINNEFAGLDVGIQDEGKNTEAEGNKFNDGENSKQEQRWHKIWWIKYLILPIIVLLAGAFLVYKLGWN